MSDNEYIDQFLLLDSTNQTKNVQQIALPSLQIGSTPNKGSPLKIWKKNQRWDSDHWAFYVAFSLEKMADFGVCQISFNGLRRPYINFDKEYAEEMVKELMGPDVFQSLPKQRIKKKITELAKRAKTKFNTLKRKYKKNQKYGELDFPFLMSYESEELLDQGESRFYDKLRAAKDRWDRVNGTKTEELPCQVFHTKIYAQQSGQKERGNPE